MGMLYSLTAALCMLLTISGTIEHSFEKQAIGIVMFCLVLYVHALMTAIDTLHYILRNAVSKWGGSYGR